MMRQALKSIIRHFGYNLVPTNHFPPIVPAIFRADLARFRAATMVEWINLFNSWNAARYVAKAGIPGAIVECGVYKGGCSALMACGLIDAGDTARDLYLYDTFEGMTEPGALDRSINHDIPANDWYVKHQAAGTGWCKGTLEDVRATMELSAYPPERIHFIKGRVEDTIPATLPDRIAVLRLDTDWYESTRHELVHLFPRLERGGVLIIDDYGTWSGARKAVDEYLAETGQNLYFYFDRSGVNATAIKI